MVQATDIFDYANGIDLWRDVVTPGRSLVLDMAEMKPAWIRQFMLDILISQVLDGALHRNEKVDGTPSFLSWMKPMRMPRRLFQTCNSPIA